MATKQFALVWYRSDLRSVDHEPLVNALKSGLPVLALYVATPVTWQQHHMAPIKQDFIRRRVFELQQELARLNIPLLTVEGCDFQSEVSVLEALLAKGALQLYFEVEYEVREVQRDKRVTELFVAAGKTVEASHRRAFFKPGTLKTKQGQMYQVFTPFKKAWLMQQLSKGVHCFKKPSAQAIAPQVQVDFPALKEGDGSSAGYEVSEAYCLHKLREFCQNQVIDYASSRDCPSKDGTSRLSAYLAIGALSVQQCVARLYFEQQERLQHSESGPSVWLSELIWRDFYLHILHAYPKLIKHKAFQEETDSIVWPNDLTLFKRWCEGRTGYPIVDAAMRQLNQTGWMHNRLRMISASFLVKDLHIDWRLGEQYFMSKLIDGDFAANNGGWQWAASTGTDAAPYFRIFNPVTQSERFDPSGEFIKRFVPELASCKGADIHWPHPLAAGSQYVAPCVNHKDARVLTLELFKNAKQQRALSKE